MVKFLNDKESIEWAKEVYGIPPLTKSFVIYGTEDCPKRIDCYYKKNPKIDDRRTIIAFPTNLF